MSESKTIGGLTISNELEEFVRNEVLEGLDIEANNFWASLESILDEFGPRNIELLEKRETIQTQKDERHK
jgi:malate synthase